MDRRFLSVGETKSLDGCESIRPFMESHGQNRVESGRRTRGRKCRHSTGFGILVLAAVGGSV